MIPVWIDDTAVGAPDLTGQDGSLYNVLKWALPQLGWTLEHDDPANFRGAWRNSPTGSGYLLRLTDSAVLHPADARRGMVEGLSSMTDIDTGADRFPTQTPQYFVKSHTLDSAPRKWFVLGTERLFYFGAYNGATAVNLGYRVYFAGDMSVYDPADPSPFVLGGFPDIGSAGSSSVSVFGNIGHGGNNTTTREELFALDFSSAAPGAPARLVSSVAAEDAFGSTSAAGKRGVYPSAIGGGLNTSRIELFAFVAARWARRGVLPGALEPMHDLSQSGVHPFVELQEIPGIANGLGLTTARYISGSWAFGIFNSSGSQFSLLLDTASDWDLW